MCWQRGGCLIVFEERSIQVNEEELEKHTGIELVAAICFCAVLFVLVMAYCITSTLGSWPSFASISFGRFLRHASSLVCNSVRRFSSACLPIGLSICVG